MAHSLAVRPSVGPRTWTVIDEGYRTVAPVEEWLEAHRHLWSPNTVRGYATALAQWWTFLEQRGEAERWREVGSRRCRGSCLGCATAARSSTPWSRRRTAPSPETLEARLAALISFYRGRRPCSRCRSRRGCCAGHRAAARPGACWRIWTRASAPGPSSMVRVRRHRSRGRPPLLLPQQIQAILDGCAVSDAGDR